MDQAIDIFIDRKVVVLHDDDPAWKAARAMCESQVGCVLVVGADGDIKGIVTDRDLACNVLSPQLDAETPLADIMETDLVSLPEASTVRQAVDLMKENGIRRLPILDESGKTRRCVGMVTLDDLIAGQFVDTADLSEIVKSQILRKKQIQRKRPAADSKLDQSYRKFLHQIAEKTGIDDAYAEDSVLFLIGSIVRRLHYTGGAHMIAQLPKLMQEHLLDLPAGPDRSVSAHSLVQGLSIRTNKNLETCKEMLGDFWQALSQTIGAGAAEHILHQLPVPIQQLFAPEEGGELRTKEAV